MIIPEDDKEITKSNEGFKIEYTNNNDKKSINDKSIERKSEGFKIEYKSTSKEEKEKPISEKMKFEFIKNFEDQIIKVLVLYQNPIDENKIVYGPMNPLTFFNFQ